MFTTPKAKRILIVDDERGFRDFLESLLGGRGYEVFTADNGQDALKCIAPKDPDLAIIDMRMPRMGGIEFYTKICTPYGYSRFPVIILTAVSQLADLFQETTVDTFLTKPVQADELLSKVDALLSGKANANVSLVDVDCPEAEEIQQVLERARFKVTRFHDLEQAVSAVNQIFPDILLVEYASSAHSGDNWAKAIRDALNRQKLCIGVYTRFDAADAQDKTIRAGADFYLNRFNDFRRLFYEIKSVRKSPVDKMNELSQNNPNKGD